ncbi:LysR family transcriptional regulator [Nonomuraea sp. SBT364]|uniref:LysR family transcriptional regulator n=1 Tax=Nonomuraea sp. SBT364 TaxID=1580530 RepID=UPI00066C604A|nr:LysR family transcriptional regulator [Nonomuraea sp. SBT364]
MELRDIEIFLTLAEELHFGRTAQRLHVTQARVSQSIRKQERRIGAPLFDRTSRVTRLTPIGERLRADLTAGYGLIKEGVEAAAAAARGVSGVLTVGTMGGMARAITDVTELFQTRYPAAELRFREVRLSDPFLALRSGVAGVALHWLPVREPDLVVGPVLRTSPMMLMVPAGHPYAGRESVCREDLGGCTVATISGPPPAYWEAANVPATTAGGRPVHRGPVVTTWQEVLTAVAAGQIVQPVQAEAARFFPWPDIVYVPFRDLPPGRWALVWPARGETPLVRALVQAARDLGYED